MAVWPGTSRQVTEVSAVSYLRAGGGIRAEGAQSQVTEKGERAQLPIFEGQRHQEETCLLAELVRIEQELQEWLRREKEQQVVRELVRQEENRQRWKSLCYMSLNQRVNKPWVFSFYKTFPMHIYCQPIRSTSHARKKYKKSRA